MRQIVAHRWNQLRKGNQKNKGWTEEFLHTFRVINCFSCAVMYPKICIWEWYLSSEFEKIWAKIYEKTSVGIHRFLRKRVLKTPLLFRKSRVWASKWTKTWRSSFHTRWNLQCLGLLWLLLSLDFQLQFYSSCLLYSSDLSLQSPDEIEFLILCQKINLLKTFIFRHHSKSYYQLMELWGGLASLLMSFPLWGHEKLNSVR